jgi:hypothetical protein
LNEKSFTERAIIAFSQNKEIMYLKIEYDALGGY